MKELAISEIPSEECNSRFFSIGRILGTNSDNKRAAENKRSQHIPMYSSVDDVSVLFGSPSLIYLFNKNVLEVDVHIHLMNLLLRHVVLPFLRPTFTPHPPLEGLYHQSHGATCTSSVQPESKVIAHHAIRSNSI